MFAYVKQEKVIVGSIACNLLKLKGIKSRKVVFTLGIDIAR
jgi:hypothetical protein